MVLLRNSNIFAIREAKSLTTFAAFKHNRCKERQAVRHANCSDNVCGNSYILTSSCACNLFEAQAEK